MFGRRRTRTGDVVATAQRRLAAIAEHEGWAPPEAAPPRPEGDGAPRAWTPGEPPAATAHQLQEPVRRGDPRHLADQRHSLLAGWPLSASHVTVAVLCVLALVVVGAWWALRSVPHSHQVTLSSDGRLSTDVGASIAASGSRAGRRPAGASVAPSSAPAPPSPTGRLVVDVAGRVRHPGIVELPAGSRVVDAITAAGGARPGVSLTSLNLARLLVDGEQILVGVRAPVGSGPPSTGDGSPNPTSTIAPVELNSATLEQLDTLPGIGPVTAAAILSWRADNGPFTSVDQLLDVSGIGAATLADIKPYVYV